ncbi:MAG: hypothetical protein OSB00_11570 [Sphingomonas bacterium]|nr:hypothetical protein [Sphingomonas bacterium]
MANSPTRSTLLTIGGALLALGFAGAGWLARQSRREGHAAPDLSPDTPRPGPDDRAPEAFRPDPTAVPTNAERDALVPATGHAPGFAADRGTTV